MDISLIGIIGFTAASVSFLMFCPQALKVWAHRNDSEALKGVSIIGQWLLLTNAILWGIYAVLTNALWSGAPGLFNGPMAIWMLVQLYKAKKDRENTELNGSKGSKLISDPV